MRIQSLFLFLLMITQQAHAGTLREFTVISLYNVHGSDIQNIKIKSSPLTLNPQISASYDMPLADILSENTPVFVEFYKLSFKLGNTFVSCDLMTTSLYSPIPPISAALQVSGCEGRLTPSFPPLAMKHYNYAQSFMLDTQFDILYIGDADFED